MSTRSIAVLVAALLLAWPVTGAAGDAGSVGDGAPSPTAAEPPTEISSCTTISRPGRYVLTSDIENSSAGTCIRIRASDVVLDGNGHAVDGVTTSDADRLTERFLRGRVNPFGAGDTVGVAVVANRRQSNVTVTDLTVTDWRWGVVTAGVRNGRLAGVRAADNGFGVTAFASPGVRVTDGTADGNAVLGVGAFQSDRARVANVDATGNGFAGVYLSGGTGGAVADVTARDNDIAGVLLAGTSGAAVTGGTASGNRIGVALLFADGTDVRRTAAVENGLAGVQAVNATGTTVFGVSAADNGLAGVVLRNGTDASVVATDASRNVVGVVLERATGTAVTDSNASDQVTGIRVINSTGGAVVDNTVLNTSYGAVWVTNSTSVRVANNRDGLLAIESTDDGIGAEGGVRHDEEIAVNQSDGLTDAELRRYVYQSIARTEHLRQLEFNGSITVDVVTRERYERRAAAEPGAGPEQSAWENQYWEALFVVGEDRNATEMLENESTRILGSFSWETDRLTLVSSEDPPVVDSTTLVHELVHVLQGQHFDLDRRRDRPRSEDGLRGSLGLIEGDAEYVAQLYEKYCGVVWDCVQVPSKDPRGGEVPEDRNFARRAIVLSPYSDGPQLIELLHERGGWAAVDEAYEHPPNTTEQFVHLDRRNQPPVPIEFENTARNGWRQFDPADLRGALQRDGRTTVGEVAVFSMFWYQGYEYGNPVVDVDNHLVPNDAPFDLYNYSSPPSAGWGNDVLVPYRKNATNGTVHGYVWQTAWDTPRDARQFYRAYRKVLRGHGAERVGPDTWVVDSGPFADAFRVVRDGRNVTVVNAPTVADLADLRPGLGESGNASGGSAGGENATTGGTTVSG
ncbi:Hvo_1808 family surface protein [Halorussus sp. AFM4]|uniref:Hvo_1808 family surface protein n=1 Tax=Halorussus sp. AFM4 TaxID=3421651 RepID=UPI003EB936D0